VQEDYPFLVMDYAPHGSLRTLHPRGTVLPPTVVLAYLRHIAPALHSAHEQQQVHGHLKPENLLVGREQTLLLADCVPTVLRQGSAPLPEQGPQAVTYCAPEQLLGQSLAASDQYALGMIVYEWLSGDLPFHGSFEELSRQQLSVSPMPLHE